MSRTVTDLPAQRLWDVLSDLESWPEWLPTVDELVPDVPGGPHGVGTRCVVVQPRLGRARWTVTEWNPGHGFTWTSSRGGSTTTGTHEIIPLADGRSEVVLGITWSGPLARLARALVGRLTRQYLDTEAGALVERAARPEPGAHPPS